MQRLKKALKELFLTKEGWMAYLLANVVTSVPWMIPAVYGFVVQNPEFYVISGSIYLFMSSKVVPFWAVNIILAVWLRKRLFGKA